MRKILVYFIRVIGLFCALGFVLAAVVSKPSDAVPFLIAGAVVGIAPFLIKSKRKQHTNEIVQTSVPEHVAGFVDTGNVVVKTDGSPIADEEVPWLIRQGYQKALEREKSSRNPKFNRSERDEELSFAFSQKYAAEIADMEKAIYVENFSITKLTVDELNEQIELHKRAIEAFDRMKKFCYGHGKGGTIYFQDMWEYCHNSKNQCFSFKDELLEAFERLEKRKQKEAAQ
ncbi:MAG: hypothetical protein LBQ15_12780 [Clostridium sp.]|jgi:hypothetical protein|nr:hypothetical protein [Clostridium sp.]